MHPSLAKLTIPTAQELDALRNQFHAVTYNPKVRGTLTEAVARGTVFQGVVGADNSFTVKTFDRTPHSH